MEKAVDKDLSIFILLLFIYFFSFLDSRALLQLKKSSSVKLIT